MNDTKRQNQPLQILVTIAAFVIVVAGMSAAKAILVPFLLAVFIAIVSSPPLFWLQRKGLPKWLALSLVILGVFVIGFLVAGLIGSSVKDFSRNLPLYEAKLRQQTVAIVAWLKRLGVDTSGLALTRIFDPGAAMKLTATILNGLGNALANAFLLLMTVILILLEASSIPAKLRTIFGGADSSLGRVKDFVNNVKRYMAIKTLVSFTTGMLVVILLASVGVGYPLLWGLLSFALDYVPSIGAIIAAVPAILLAMIQLGFMRAVLVAVGYIVISFLMSSVIEPRFMGRGLGLSTLMVFLSLLFWGWVLGPVGMLLSVPLTITAKIALDSREDTRWLSVLLGPATVTKPKRKKTDRAAGETE